MRSSSSLGVLVLLLAVSPVQSDEVKQLPEECSELRGDFIDEQHPCWSALNQDADDADTDGADADSSQADEPPVPPSSAEPPR